MAASVFDFISKTLKATKGAISRNINIGKFLTSYFGLTDSDQEKVDQIKKLFKIDGILRIVGAENGFVGYVNWQGVNGKYHNQTTRDSGVKISKNGFSYNLLNDSGLNRKGDCEIISIVNSNSTSPSDDPALYIPSINSCKAYIKYSSSVYNPTLACKMRVNNYTEQTLGSVPTLNNELVIDSGNLASLYSFESGVNTRFTPSISNEEGTYAGDFIDVQLNPAQYSLKYGTTIENAFNSTSMVTVYVNNYDESSDYAPFRNPIEYTTGSILFNSSSMHNYSPFGYYMDQNNHWYYFGYSVLYDQTIVHNTGIYNEPTPSTKPRILDSIESEGISLQVINTALMFNVQEQETAPYYNKMASINFSFQVPDLIPYMKFVLVSPDGIQYLIQEYYNYDNIGWNSVSAYISGLTLNDNEVWQIRLLDY